MMNMLRTLIENLDNMLEKMDDINGQMKILDITEERINMPEDR